VDSAFSLVRYKQKSLNHQLIWPHVVHALATYLLFCCSFWIISKDFHSGLLPKAVYPHSYSFLFFMICDAETLPISTFCQVAIYAWGTSAGINIGICGTSHRVSVLKTKIFVHTDYNCKISNHSRRFFDLHHLKVWHEEIIIQLRNILILLGPYNSRFIPPSAFRTISLITVMRSI